MCGIVGYVGDKQVAPVLLDGLSKLEYRGYDSAGIAVYGDGKINVAKARGRLKVLSEMTNEGKSVSGVMGIGHTRWATHGEPSDVNSHPHVSSSGRFAVVHNGIIENYIPLKKRLMNKGYEFVSETDTEIIAQLIEYYYKGDLLEALIKVIERVEGSYALGVFARTIPTGSLRSERRVRSSSVWERAKTLSRPMSPQYSNTPATCIIWRTTR